METAPESDEVEVSAILHPDMTSGCSCAPEVISELTERMKWSLADEAESGSVLSLRRRDSGSSCTEAGSCALRMGGWAEESKLAMEKESEVNIRLMEASAHLSAIALRRMRHSNEKYQLRIFHSGCEAASGGGGGFRSQKVRRLEIPSENCAEEAVAECVLTPPE